MPNTLLDSGPVPLSPDAPTFVPRKGVLLREYHVLVKWADGRRTKIGTFPRKPDARRWIEQESADWLAEHLTAGTSNGEQLHLSVSV